MSDAPLVYLAGPLFSEAERAFNAALAAQLEAAGLAVFLPQRDGVRAERPPYAAMSRPERRRATFELDRAQIRACDVFLFVLDGRVPDEGACVELGLAYADRKLGSRDRLLIGLHTDSRAAFMGGKLNPMIAMALDLIVEDREALLATLQPKQE